MWARQPWMSIVNILNRTWHVVSKVFVDEPSVEDTIAILRGLQERYELHHHVEITDPAIVSGNPLSHRYISDRQLPDKAIDLIDERHPVFVWKLIPNLCHWIV